MTAPRSSEDPHRVALPTPPPSPPLVSRVASPPTRGEVAALDPLSAHAPRDECLDVLARRIAHEFNNLLAGILGNAALLLLDADPASDAAEALTDIKLAAERATTLTGELLAMARRGNAAAAPLTVGTGLRDT